MWGIFIPIYFFFVLKHVVPCVLEKIIMAEVSGYIVKHVNVINVFRDLNLIHGDQQSPQGQVY